MSSRGIDGFLRSHKSLSWSGNKIVCKLTGHEMVPKMEALESYVSGKKYLRALESHSFDFSKYKASYIFPGRDDKTVYCQVTKQTLNRIPSEVDNHIRGKQYQQDLKRYEDKLDRTKAANAKRDAKVREASEKGWVTKDKSNPIEKRGKDDDAVDMSALGEISKPQERKKFWFDDLSDLNPGLNSDSRPSELHDADYTDGHPIMDFLAQLAASDDEDAQDDHEASEDEVVPPKDTKKARSSTKSSKSSDKPTKEVKEPRKSRKSGEKTKSALAESVEEELKPKFKSMKESSRDKKEKRDKRRSRAE